MKRRKPRTIPLAVTPLPSKAAKLPGIGLGTLQADFVASGRLVKSTATNLARALDAADAARAKHIANGDKLKAASRAVLADN